MQIGQECTAQFKILDPKKIIIQFEYLLFVKFKSTKF